MAEDSTATPAEPENTRLPATPEPTPAPAPPDAPTPPQTAEARAEAAAARRLRIRLLTLGEVIAVAALVISALTFWNSYDERRSAQADKAADAKHEAVKARTLILRSAVQKDGDRIELTAAGGQAIQSQTIAFPKALGVDPVDSTDPRIEADWFASGLKKARKAAGEEDRPHGDARLPIAITTRFTADDGDMAETTALYDVGYGTDSSFLGGTSIRLRGLSLIGRSTADAAAAKIDSLWKARHPAKKD